MLKQVVQWSSEPSAMFEIMLVFLSRWVQTECRRLGDVDNPEVGELLRTAVRCLKERPVLFKYCAEEVTYLSYNNNLTNFATIYAFHIHEI